MCEVLGQSVYMYIKPYGVTSMAGAISVLHLFIQQKLKAYCAQPMFKMQCVSSVRAPHLDQAFRLLSFLVETAGSQNGPAASVGVGGTVHVNSSLVQTMTAHKVFGESVPLSP